MTTTVLGLDLQAGGYALLFKAPGLGTGSMTGTLDCRAEGGSANLRAFEPRLRQNLSCGVDRVFYVHSRKRRSEATDRYVELKDKMIQVCAEVGVACEALSSGEVKTFATGSHRASKEDLRRAAEIFRDDRMSVAETSAMFIARCGMEMAGRLDAHPKLLKDG